MRVRLRKISFALMAVAMVLVIGSCSENALTQFEDGSDESLYFAAKQHMNNSLWTDAITKFGQMSATYLARDDVRLTYAQAYAGRCGLDFLTLVESLAAAGTSSLFTVLMQAFPGATTTNIDDCIAAEDLMEQIGATAADRSVDENLNMAFIGFAKMGAILAAYADDSELPAGTLDSGFDACSNTEFEETPRNDVQHLGTGLTVALASLGAAGSTIGGGELSDLTAICAVIDGGPLDFCDTTDEAAFDANQIKGIRSLVKESAAVGLGQCTGDVSTCFCP